MLEPVAAEYCERTVEDGDTLAVEYEGRSEICIFLFEDICCSRFEACSFFTNSYFSLEDGTVFDSSESRGAPFGKILVYNNVLMNCRLQGCIFAQAHLYMDEAKSSKDTQKFSLEGSFPFLCVIYAYFNTHPIQINQVFG